MKRTVSVRDDEGEDAADDGPEHKRVKEEADQPEAVLELSVDDFECVICCGELLCVRGVYAQEKGQGVLVSNKTKHYKTCFTI